MTTETIIRLLTISALAGLLFTVGLRLTLAQVLDSLRRCRFALILIVNFAVVPALTVLVARVFRIEPPIAIAMVLLAGAPFAPVVPVFARLAKADLALAAGLTSAVPVLCAVLTPIVCVLAMKGLSHSTDLNPNLPGILVTLLATIVLPIGIGVAVNHFGAEAGRRMMRPIEIVAEVAGALSLMFVTFTELGAILDTGWRSLLAMVIISEVSFFIGWHVAGGHIAARQVVALGTSNRNIALALLVALENFSGSAVVPAVVANGLVLIGLGLLHVAWWRFRAARPSAG